MNNKVRPTYAAAATQRTVESDVRRFPALLRTMDMKAQAKHAARDAHVAEDEVDEIAAEFFSQASLPPVTIDIDDDFQPMSRGSRAAMHATIAMLTISSLGLGAFLVYSRLIMPVPEELGEIGVAGLDVPVAASAPEPEAAPRYREWRAQLFDPSAPRPAPPPDSDEAMAAQPEAAAVEQATASRAAALPNEDLVKRAFGSLQRGDAPGALDLARRATLESPARADAWIALGRVYDAMHDSVNAREAIRSCLKSASGPNLDDCRALVRD